MVEDMVVDTVGVVTVDVATDGVAKRGKLPLNLTQKLKPTGDTEDMVDMVVTAEVTVDMAEVTEGMEDMDMAEEGGQPSLIEDMVDMEATAVDMEAMEVVMAVVVTEDTAGAVN